MVLGYYKYLFKLAMLQAFLKFRLRRKNNIGKHCYISKNSILEGNNRIGNYTNIGDNVVLGKNVIVGNLSRISNITLGENSHIESGVVCTGYGKGKIIIGKESYIGVNNILDFSDNITIGNFVHIAGPSTGLWTHSSAKMCLNGDALNNKTLKNRPTAPITIEDNVYIGGNCTIYSGVTIHHHSIVAPNSAVSKDVLPYTMVGGVPAKVIKRIKK